MIEVLASSFHENLLFEPVHCKLVVKKVTGAVLLGAMALNYHHLGRNKFESPAVLLENFFPHGSWKGNLSIEFVLKL